MPEYLISLFRGFRSSLVRMYLIGRAFLAIKQRHGRVESISSGRKDEKSYICNIWHWYELGNKSGGPGHRSRYLSHAKRALYHVS